ncbi:hypothetical protein [Streptomyces shenzhenensis]|uniref:hypothetical protein n=1 Tax=Streptomyces shenzhenensis TaxID=943815 RepID=UPI001F319F84|nr:hypothetical protein [Streptomyces shenzhenensis]
MRDSCGLGGTQGREKSLRGPHHRGGRCVFGSPFEQICPDVAVGGDAAEGFPGERVLPRSDRVAERFPVQMPFDVLVRVELDETDDLSRRPEDEDDL